MSETLDPITPEAAPEVAPEAAPEAEVAPEAVQVEAPAPADVPDVPADVPVEVPAEAPVAEVAPSAPLDAAGTISKHEKTIESLNRMLDAHQTRISFLAPLEQEVRSAREKIASLTAKLETALSNLEQSQRSGSGHASAIQGLEAQIARYAETDAAVRQFVAFIKKFS